MFWHRLIVLLLVITPMVWWSTEMPSMPAQDTKTPEEEGRPLLLTATPAGATIGQSVEVVCNGAELIDATALWFSDSRIKAERIPEPMEPETKETKEKKKDKMKAPPTTDARFRVSVPAGVTPGMIDVRVITPSGITNPRTFIIDTLPVVNETEPNSDIDKAERVTIGTAMHGVITQSTDVDYWVFAGKKGQHIIAECLTSSMDSRLQAELQLFDAAGKELAQNRNYRGDDAVIDAVLPQDGDYYLRITQFTYTSGGTDYFYRVNLTSGPWIDAVYPNVIEPGKTAQVTFYGRNLPGSQADDKMTINGHPLEKLTVAITAPKTGDQLDYAGAISPAMSAVDGFTYQLKAANGTSNPILITYARAPVVIETGGDDMASAQLVSLPSEIVGRIEKKGDRDWYRFTAKKGDVISIDSLADRLGSPVDLYCTLYDSKDKMVREFDDDPDMLHPTQFYSRTDDPQTQRYEVPADGDYRLMVSTREAYVQAGVRDMYRISIGAEQPDFRLVVMPSSPYYSEGCIVPRNGQQALAVFVWRRDGFAEPIELSADKLPAGIQCAPQTISGRANSATLVLQADGNAKDWNGSIVVRGKSKVNGKDVSHTARSATIIWGSGLNQDQLPQSPLLTRLDRELVIGVREPASFRLSAKGEKGEKGDLIASQGDKVIVSVTVERTNPKFKTPVIVTMLGLPPGVKGVAPNGKLGTTVTPGGDKTETKITIDLKKGVPPGRYELVARGQTNAPKKNNNNNKVAFNPISVSSGPLTLVVLPTEVVKVKVTPTDAKGKVGETIAVQVELERLNDYDGPFKLDVIFPDNAKFLSAKSLTVEKGKNEAEVRVKIADDAKVTTVPKILIRATAQVAEKKELVSEGRLNLTVAK